MSVDLNRRLLYVSAIEDSVSPHACVGTVSSGSDIDSLLLFTEGRDGRVELVEKKRMISHAVSPTVVLYARWLFAYRIHFLRLNSCSCRYPLCHSKDLHPPFSLRAMASIAPLRPLYRSFSIPKLHAARHCLRFSTSTTCRATPHIREGAYNGPDIHHRPCI